LPRRIAVCWGGGWEIDYGSKTTMGAKRAAYATISPLDLTEGSPIRRDGVHSLKRGEGGGRSRGSKQRIVFRAKIGHA